MHLLKTIGLLLGLLTVLLQSVALAQSAGPAFLLPNVSSSAGEPLQARLPLTGLAAVDGPFYSAAMASPSAYQAQQVRRYEVVESIALQVTANSSGAQVLQLSTDSPIYEPSLRILVELTGPRSTRILPLELLLPIAGDPGRSQRQILVYPNDTLWRVANRTREAEVSNNQQMLAMQRLNADAFLSNNINGLKEWSMLLLPTYAQAIELPRQEAAQIVAEQNARWRSPQRRSPGGQQSQTDFSQSPSDSPEQKTSQSQPLGQVRITVADEFNLRDSQPAVSKGMPSDALPTRTPQNQWSGEPTFTEAPVDELTYAPQADEFDASAEAETGDFPAEVAPWTSGQPMQSAAPESSPPAERLDETAAPAGTMPDAAASAVPSNGEDPFDLARLEAQIRDQEAGFDRRLISNLMSPRGIGLLAGIVFIALLVMLLLRRRSVEQEQALNRALPDEEPLIGKEIAEQNDNASVEDGSDGVSGTETVEFAAAADAEAEAEAEAEDVYITRLKLAEAYLEMGDVDGATEMLEEVMTDGNPEQQEVARRIMERVAENDD